jgi:hypothetical protein
MKKRSIEARLIELATNYARNRAAILENSRAIREVQEGDSDAYFDLKPFRQEYIDGEQENAGWQGVQWYGWLHAVDTVQGWKDIEPDEDCGFRAIAKLLDERKVLQIQGSRIRRSLCVIGQQIEKAGAKA